MADKDWWDKLDIVMKPVGGLITAIAIGLLGFFGSSYLETWKEYETKSRMLADILSRREAAENDLRKDMFQSIMQSFFDPKSSRLEAQVISLELLTYNFHESLDISPLYKYLLRRIRNSEDSNRQEYIKRLGDAAREIKTKQMLILESVGARADMEVNLEQMTKDPDFIPRQEFDLKVGDVRRLFMIAIPEMDVPGGELRIELGIRTLQEPGKKSQEVQPEEVHASFWVGQFAFPTIDNTRLSHDQRCAVILKGITPRRAYVSVLYFPGSYSSLKEKPYYQEVLNNLLGASREGKIR